MERLREIYDQFGGDVERVADQLGLSTTELASRLQSAPVSHSLRRRPPADLGRPEMRQYQISARHADHPTWPKEDQHKIEQARAQYEAGTHEMCQGRDRDWFALYLIPRVKRVGARKFFRTFE